jgi:L-serine dehydratase
MLQRLIKKIEQTASVQVELYGSLALTGRGHGTDRAVILGLCGERPEEVDPEHVASKIETVRREGWLRLLGLKMIPFVESALLFLHKDLILLGHPNAMRFSAFDSRGFIVSRETYYSIGGRFVLRKGGTTRGCCIAAAGRVSVFEYTALAGSRAKPSLHNWELMLENERALTRRGRGSIICSPSLAGDE